MSNDTYFEKKVAHWLSAIRDAATDSDPYRLEQALRMFAKEVERDTRHLAADLAGALQRDIHNLRHPEN